MTLTVEAPAEFVNRIDMTVVDILCRARRLVASYGHDGDGFGKASTGFSIEGAVYFAAGFHQGPYDLRDPEADEIDLFKRCNTAFGVIARLLGADAVPAGRAYIAVIEANSVLNQADAVLLLDRAAVAAKTLLLVGAGHYGRDGR
jgi:hypothetical protein